MKLTVRSLGRGLAHRQTPTSPAADELWVPWDRTAGVIGPQGSRQDPRPAHPRAARCTRAPPW